MRLITTLFFALIYSIIRAQDWSSVTVFPGSEGSVRREGISVSIGNKGYIGLGLSSTILKDFWEFNTVTNTWTRLQDFPGQARHNAVAFVIGSDIYVGTGDVANTSSIYNTGVYKKDFYKFNTLTNTWSRIADYPEIRGEALAFTINGKGYVTCGRNYEYPKNDLYCYDPITDVWTKKADFPSNARSYPIGFAIGDKAYVGGGYTGQWYSDANGGYSPQFFNDFWEYNPSNDQWINKGTTYNAGRVSEAISIATCDKGYLIGGRYLNKPESYPDCCYAYVIEYDPINNSWTKKNSFPQPVVSGAGWYINGALFAGLGFSESFYSFPIQSISSQSIVCSTGTTLALNNAPVGTTVTWTTTPASLFAASSGTGSSATLMPSSPSSVGSAQITFTIQNVCGTPIQVSKTVWIGKPMIDGSYNGQLLRFMLPDEDIIPYNLVCSGPYTTCNMSFRGSTSGNWQKVSSNPSGLSWSQSGNDLNFYFWAVNQTSSYRLTTSNVCGTTTNYYYFKSIDCSGGGGGDPCNPEFSVSPNPSSNTINIVVPNVPPPCESAMLTSSGTESSDIEKTKNTRTIQSVSLHDSEGILKHSQQFTGSKKSVSIDISDLNKGIYILQVFDGINTETHRIVKE